MMTQNIYNPMPLHNYEEIRKAFSVGNETIQRWIQAGAPIVKLKSSVHTEYTTMFAWLLEHPETAEIDES